MNAAARTNGARVYPEDPDGESDFIWLARADWKRVLEAGRANAPIFPADSGLAGTVTNDGLVVRLADRDERPFTVSLSLTESGGYVALVSSRGSTLQALGFNPTDTLPIVGLYTWRPVQAGHVCYLRGTVATNVWEIFFGEEWAEDLPPFTLDESDEVEFIYRLIARFEVDPLGGTLKVRQVLRSALRLESRLEGGVYLDYPVPDSEALAS